MKETKKEDKKEVCEEKPQLTKKEIKEQNKTIRQVLVVSGILIMAVILFVVFINSIRHFEYDGVEFKVIKEGKLILYNVAFPINNAMTGNHIADYNFYIRNDPRELEEIPYEGGNIHLKKILVINSAEDFNCEGDGMIAIANLLKLYEFIGTSVMKDPNATCDPMARYMMINLQSSNVSSIKQIGPACFNLNIADCDILKITEKFMVKTFPEIETPILSSASSISKKA